MSFIAFDYLWFFPTVFVLYWCLGRVGQNALLVVSSFIFYGWIHPWFCSLLLTSAIVDYIAGAKIESDRENAGRWLTLSIATNMGMLCFFKYCDFFLDNVISVMEALGVSHNVHTLGLLLPVGISFFTFQTMSYTIDIYREQLKPRDNVLDYLVFISFFPQLVAGPVERASNMLPQVEADRVWSWTNMRSGFALCMWGAFKKVVIADTIAPYVDFVFVTPNPSFAMVWAGGLGFGLQILADFSAYTDLARGSARMLGFELIRNFDKPFIAATPMEYFQRWHMSFSTWLRDYVYMPAIFSTWVRKWVTVPGTGRWGAFAHQTRATYITFVASAIWHGATWAFLAWGLYYATLITGYTYVQKKVLPKSWKKWKRGRYLGVPLMFVFTVFGMLIFREPTLGSLVNHMMLNPFAGTEAQWMATAIIVANVIVYASPMMLAMALQPKLDEVAERGWFLPVQTTAWAAFAFGIFVFARDTKGDFVYFQF